MINVRERLNYDSETGIFIWKPRVDNKKWNSLFAGKIAGFTGRNGYLEIKIDGKRYRADCLAWLYIHGELPKNEISHINRKKSDNRLINLKDVAPVVSKANGLPPGVYWHTKAKIYQARIPRSVPVFGYVYLGQYRDPIAAEEVVQEGIEIICNNKDEEIISILLRELKDSWTEILPKSGLPKGVKKSGSKFAAQIYRNKKMVHLGTFDTIEKASEAYFLAKV
jgi:hypothetical protein